MNTGNRTDPHMWFRRSGGVQTCKKVGCSVERRKAVAPDEFDYKVNGEWKLAPVGPPACAGELVAVEYASDSGQERSMSDDIRKHLQSAHEELQDILDSWRDVLDSETLADVLDARAAIGAAKKRLEEA